MSKSLLVEMAIGGCLVLAASYSYAQSTATQIEDQQLGEVVVAGQKTSKTVAGLIQAEQATKSRSTITAEYLETQPSGQTVIQSMNLLPGVNFTNSDPYGSSGGNLRIRSFDGARISLMLDGIQLNDTGNYAIYTNQQLDSEIIERVTLNLGTTDVDSPTASATGGTINLTSARPKERAGITVAPSIGSYEYRRIFLRGDTGSFGPLGTTAYVAFSMQDYEKFKGPGDIEKRQINARLYQDLDDGDFISFSIHGNRNRNDFYRFMSKADLATNGYEFDNDPTCARLAPVAGSQQNEGTSATSTTSICNNYYGVRINPTDTANIRAQASFGLTDSLRLTVDPSFQYVQANGGGITVVPENDRRLIGAATTVGVDLNGDGDTLDRISLFTPNNTNTHRYGLNSSLLWTLSDTSLLRFGYTLDYGRHRQTGQFGPLDANGNPLDVFAGLGGTPVQSADGVDLRGRDRYSVARLNQLSMSFSSSVLDDKLRYTVGVRAPFFERELNQYCYTSTAGSQYCTSQTPSAPNASGFVTFTGVSGSYLPPYSGTKKYDKVLPNVGLSFHPWSDEHQFYTSFAQGFSAPRTDNLYNIQILNVEPESTNSFDLGYRFQGSSITASAAAWSSRYKSRIVTAFDPDLGLSVDRNVGAVDLMGIDAELGFQPTESLAVYASTSFISSEVKNDIQYSGALFVPTGGKELVETPDFQFGTRVQYTMQSVVLGLQGKYVGERWSTDLNDESAPSYTVMDADARYSLKIPGFTESYIQVNLTNLFDREYLGSITTSRFSADTTQPYGGIPLYALGAPRTVQVSLNASF